jgi:hypothetical protein
MDAFGYGHLCSLDASAGSISRPVLALASRLLNKKAVMISFQLEYL